MRENQISREVVDAAYQICMGDKCLDLPLDFNTNANQKRYYSYCQ